MPTDTEPKDLYNLIKNTARVTYGATNNWWDELRKIANELCGMSKENKIEDILIGGWHLDEELHGGYEQKSGNREVLGRGVLLYRGKFPESKEKPDLKTTSSITVEAWKQDKKVIYLALRTVTKDGYVGVDNHYGKDTTWEVIGLRIVDL